MRRGIIRPVPDLSSLSSLRTLELFDAGQLASCGLVQSLGSILPQIHKLNLYGAVGPCVDNSLFVKLTGLRSIRFFITKHPGEYILDSMFNFLDARDLEEMVLDMALPRAVLIRPYRFIQQYSFDKWRDTLRVFRFRGYPIEPGLKAYLEEITANCKVVDIQEIPAEPEKGHKISLWKG
jgi:hypothetical protein